MHETGHAIHIAAIRTRPAFLDWPDDDAFTEGIADIAALEVDEPAWQKKWLGDAAPLADDMRSRYAAIMMDVCWSLFEIRMHEKPGSDPNAVWTQLTSQYLRITPHAELSWWARRGQLVDVPGYMSNYAIGAIVIADIRARVIELHGDFATRRHDMVWLARAATLPVRSRAVLAAGDRGSARPSAVTQRVPGGSGAHERRAGALARAETVERRALVGREAARAARAHFLEQPDRFAAVDRMQIVEPDRSPALLRLGVG